MKFEDNYFKNYGGKGVSYEESFYTFTADPSKVQHLLALKGIHPKSCYDIGCGTGAYLEYLQPFFDLEVMEGCEISKYACNRAIPELKPYIKNCGITQVKPKRTYDLVICNMLMYIKERNLYFVFHKMRELGHEGTVYCIRFAYDLLDGCYWYVDSKGKPHYVEHTYTDENRITNRPKVWWIKKLLSSGFNIIEDDNDTFVYCTKVRAKKVVDKSPVTFLSVGEVNRKKMHNSISPFKVTIDDYSFYFYWHTDFETAIEFGKPLGIKEYEKRRKLYTKLRTILLSGDYVPVYTFYLRPIQEFSYEPGFTCIEHNEQFYHAVDCNYYNRGYEPKHFKKLF